MATETQHGVLVSVDADHLKAWIRLRQATDSSADSLTPGDVLAALESAKVAVTDDVRSRVDAFVTACTGHGATDEPFLAAEGQPSIEGTPGRFVWDDFFTSQQDAEDGDESGRIDYRTVNMIRTAEKDQTVGRLVPPVPGTPGRDVHGHEIKPKRRVEPIRLQSNLVIAEDGESVVTTAAGRIVLKAGTLSLEEILEIRGDVDFECGNINATSDVYVTGTVHDLFEVASRKNITIGGAVEAARVIAGEDVVVRGGVLLRSKGFVRADGQIAAKFCDEASLQAGGNIQIAREAINSCIHTMGTFQSPRGALIGGVLYARNGAVVHTVGSDAGVTTRVYVGLHPTVFKRRQEVEEEVRKREESVKKIRTLVGPLLSNVKRLAPSQKEQATELMYKADEVEQGIRELQSEQGALERRYAPDEEPSIEVQSRICQNGILVLNDLEVHFHKEHRGPCRIERRKIQNVTELVAVNTLTGSVTTLPSRSVDLNCVPPEEVDPALNADQDADATD